MNLLFDYDGTLHDSSATYLPAFRKTLAWLEEHGYDVDREYSDEQIGYWLGFSAKDMWNSFAPELDDAVKETCSKMNRRRDAPADRGGKSTALPRRSRHARASQGRGAPAVLRQQLSPQLHADAPQGVRPRPPLLGFLLLRGLRVDSQGGPVPHHPEGLGDGDCRARRLHRSSATASTT